MAIVYHCKHCKRCVKKRDGVWKHSSPWADKTCKSPEPDDGAKYN
jgi:hypothetical protein